jgi:hypothetical protein
MVDFALGSHHKVIFTERISTLITFGAKQSDVVALAVGLAVAHEASAALVEELAALLTLEARCVPLQIGRDPQDVLVVDLSAAAHAMRQSLLLCKKKRPSVMLKAFCAIK